MSRALVLAFAAIILLVSSSLYANGVLVVNASSGVYARVDTSLVSVDIQGQVAVTTTTQIFRNVTGTKANVGLNKELYVANCHRY